ncbi:MAG TPA: MarR family transcriptional regulator [Syntrophomonadaceae bacterium]|nr:MarR family transcriptional regulator [Syntrophomonadaceae bacterium]
MLNFTTFWCFRFNALSRKVSRLYNTRCLDHGVTAAQSFVIFDVMDHQGTSVKDIATRIQLDSPAVTGLIDRLVKEDLIARKEDPADRRSLKIYLTKKGQTLAEQHLVPVAIQFNCYLRGMVEPEASDVFQGTLDLFDRQLNKAFE